MLTERSTEYFKSVVGNIKMWDGAGLVDAYGGDTGNLSDLKMKGLVATHKSGNHSFAYLTPKGWALAERLGLAEDIGSYTREWATVNPDGTFPTPKQKVPTAEQITERSRPNLEGQAAAYWRAVINPHAKITSVRDRAYQAGDGDLWAASWKLDRQLKAPYTSNAERKKLESMKRHVDSQIKFRYLTDPSADGNLGDGTSINPDDFRELAARRMAVPTADNIDELLKGMSHNDPLRQRIEKSREDHSDDGGPAGPDADPKATEKAISDLGNPVPTPEVTAPPAEPVGTPLEKAIARLNDSLTQKQKDEGAKWGIEGDPASGEFTINRPGEPFHVTRDKDGVLVYGKSSSPLSAWLPDIWKATRGEGRSYDTNTPTPYWSPEQKADFSVDYGIPQPPSFYHYNNATTAAERRAFSAAQQEWGKDAAAALKRGGPDPIDFGVNDPASASDAQLEAALAKADALGVDAYKDHHRILDSRKALNALDHYQSDRSFKRTAAINDAAAPLREEMKRRLDAQVGGQTADYDGARWDAARGAGPNTDDNPAGGLDEAAWDKARDSYVGNDVQTVTKNAELRSSSPSSAAKSWRSRMDKWIKSTVMEGDAVTYRGIAATPALIRQMKPGALVTDPGIVSTDESEGSAIGYLESRMKVRGGAMPLLFEILVPGGHPVADAMYGEFVLPSNTPMVIKKVSIDDDGTYRVSLEVGADVGGVGGPAGVTASVGGLLIRQTLRERVWQ